MRTKSLVLSAAAGLAAVLSYAGSGSLQSQNPAALALTGQVSSAEEGPMEGVLVSARKAGSAITVTAASDRAGRYRFPRGRLDPGSYSLRVRAVGYDLDDPGAVEVAADKAAAADLKLRKAKDLASQLSNAEWILSMPGTDQQKGFLLNCVNCHRLDLITKSRHTTEEFLQVLERMGSYANSATPLRPQKRLAERLLEQRGEERQQTRRRQAEYLSTINLRPASTWSYDFKTLPRPTGRGAQVIITEYDLPRRTIQPHDVILDSEGMVWYSNFGEQAVGKLDPKTGQLTEFTVPETKPGWPTGELGLQTDKDGNLWFGMMFQAGIAKFDRGTQKFQVFPAPLEFNKDMTQVNMPAPQRSFVDGKVWMQNNGFAAVHRLDLATGKIETFDPFRNSKEGENHNIYDVIPDSRNNAYFTDFANEHIGRIDAKTGKVTLYPTPTRGSAPRRGQMDSEDRVWFGEYRGNRIGMFDTRSERFEEWLAPTPWSAPYDVVLDKNGRAWTGSMTTDRVLRLDPKTGQFTEYLLPRPANIRRVFVDDSSMPPTLWVGNNHGASIIKLEPLD
ncbi:MAG: carboxypeptidase regulatory-like domain-containing protein [Acidobacteria bacterium]|nr:carboxypeptidase regulatory-like domain-containing protein [Acidobacteriota bacterium]